MRQQRVLFVFVALALGFGSVLFRLVKLQVFEGELWLRESERSTVSFTSLPFERGWIFDRKGEPLARHLEVRDLVFRYRDWRRRSVVGAASHAWAALGATPPAVPRAYDTVADLVGGLGAVTVAEIAALEPRQRRRDLGFYLELLLGEAAWDSVASRLRDERGFAASLAELPGFAEGVAAALARAARERTALIDLARVIGTPFDELLEQMDAAGQRALERVTAAMESQPDEAREAYIRSQRLHAEFDADPVLVGSGVSYDTQTLVAIRGAQLGGMDIHTESRRHYPANVADVAPALVGTVGTPWEADMTLAWEHRRRLADLSSLPDLTARELDELELLRIQVREVDYKHGEERGRLGLEAALEEVLRGKRGWVATSEGRDQVNVRRHEAQRGLNVVLTLDVGLQQAAQDVLDAMYADPPEVVTHGRELPATVPDHWSGSIVLLDPTNGQVFALASGPRASRTQLDEDYAELLQSDPLGLLQHRAIGPGASGNLPPPGSTFKPVSALAGLLSSNGITRHSTLLCEGSLLVGDRTMGCLGNHGEIGLAEALARSCNIFFYRLARTVGADELSGIAARFGFGGDRSSGMLIGNETLAALAVPVASGLHESRARLGPGPYSTTDAMRLAIGQAPLDDVTPLQVASMMGAVGTGYVRPPALVLSIEGYPEIPPRPGMSLGVPEVDLDAVRGGLADVIDELYGTAHELSTFLKQELPWLDGQIAAKTGTAEVGGRRTHAWFAGYMPRDDPRLAFSVLVEDCDLHGGEAARPVLQNLLRQPAVQEFLWEHVANGGAER